MRVLVAMAFCAAALAFAGTARAEDCGTYPAAVQERSVYGGFADCQLAAFGEPPLWKGLPKGTKQVTRFAFTDGHLLFFRSVTIVERDDGSAELVAIGTARRSGIRTPEQRLPTRRVELSPQQVARIDQLAADADLWKFEVGTWDGDGLYLHCQTLDMERANAEGYRFSSVNISCNQPAKLMPLVHEIVTLAGLSVDGSLFY